MIGLLLLAGSKSTGQAQPTKPDIKTKYADDSSLLVPDKYDVDLSEELRNVLKWAEHNKMQVNMTKTKEIVFHRPNARNVLFRSELPGIKKKEYYVPSC